jgi:uncharacterized MAPEG superfamily protein
MAAQRNRMAPTIGKTSRPGHNRPNFREGAMTLAEWMLPAAVILYLLTLAPLKPIGHARFDNHNPRDPAFFRPGVESRALGAHLNGIEAFPFFAAAVILAELHRQPQAWTDALAVAFVTIRGMYVASYLFDRPTTRTLIWNLGFLVNLALFALPAWSPAFHWPGK